MLLIVLFLGMMPSPSQLSPNSYETFELEHREWNRSQLKWYTSTVKKYDTIIANTNKAIAILEKNDSVEAKSMMVDLKGILASEIRHRKWAQEYADRYRSLVRQ